MHIEPYKAISKIENETRTSLSQSEMESDALARHQTQLVEKEQVIQALTMELAQIKNSKAWSIIKFLRQVRAILIPHGSIRERIVRVLMNRLRVLQARWDVIRIHSSNNTMVIKQGKTVRDLAKNWDDEKYFTLILKSVTQPYIDGIKMPGFPSDEIQRQFVGSTKEHALQEGFNFYKYVKRYCESLGVPISTKTAVLDFGCGWGRNSRFFFKDVDSVNFYGVDVDPEMISFCTSAMTCGNYAIVHPEPPTTFESNSLDVIFAYSVFSHLAEPVALKWIEEFSRILKPNGILLATTQSRSFLDFCKSFQDKKEEELEFGWFKKLAQSFIPIEKAKQDYDNGEFLYSSTGGGGPRDKSFYGEALIPRRYIEKKYTPFLSLQDFVDDPTKLPQALFVMQKII